jgi:riboflavin kinase/FMN adenylyltransferase
MLIIDWLQFTEKGLPLEQKLSSATVGVFDGVHRGHQALIERILSHNANYVPVIFTFRENHKTEDADIQSFQQKLANFKRLGVKITVVIDFTESFRRMQGIEFLETLFKHGSIGFFAAGSSFRCGFQLDTDAAAIQKFFNSRDIPVEIVPEVTEGSLPISSSRIRKCINGGDLQLAETMLGRQYNSVEFDNEPPRSRAPRYL